MGLLLFTTLTHFRPHTTAAADAATAATPPLPRLCIPEAHGRKLYVFLSCLPAVVATGAMGAIGVIAPP